MSLPNPPGKPRHLQACSGTSALLGSAGTCTVGETRHVHLVTITEPVDTLQDNQRQVVAFRAPGSGLR